MKRKRRVRRSEFAFDAPDRLAILRINRSRDLEDDLNLVAVVDLCRGEEEAVAATRIKEAAKVGDARNDAVLRLRGDLRSHFEASLRQGQGHFASFPRLTAKLQVSSEPGRVVVG